MTVMNTNSPTTSPAAETPQPATPVTADAIVEQVRAGDCIQHRPELRLDRRPAVGLLVERAHVRRRLSDRLLDEICRADHVDRLLQNLVVHLAGDVA